MRSGVRHDIFGRERIGVCLDLDDIGGIVLMRMMRACRLMGMRRFQMRNRSRKSAMRDQEQCQQKQEMELAHRRAVSRSQANGQAAGTGF